METTVNIYGGCASKLGGSELELVGSMWELLVKEDALPASLFSAKRLDLFKPGVSTYNIREWVS